MIKSERHILLDKNPVISHFSFSPPLVATADLKNEACFIFPINAEGNIYRTDGKKTVKTNNGILMRCGSYINKWESVDKSKDAEVVIIRFLPEILSQILDSDLQVSIKDNYDEKLQKNSSAVVPLDILLQKYLESLFFYFDNPQIVSTEIALLKIKELSLLLLKTNSPNPVKNLFLSLFEPAKFTLQDVVDANFRENLSMEELAKLSNMSISTFKRKFKNLIGEPPGSYIRKKRLEWALSMLKNSTVSVSDIAFDAGFEDPNYFSKVFSKHFGLSPSRYRLDFSSS